MYIHIHKIQIHMKKKIFIGIGVVLLAFVLFVVYVNVFPASPPKKASVSDKGLDIEVMYGGPYKKGRLIFGEEKDKALQPYGKYWRLGANAATEITFSKNIVLGTSLLMPEPIACMRCRGQHHFRFLLTGRLVCFSQYVSPIIIWMLSK